MPIKFVPSSSRGSGDYGWLKTRYSFSFANWYDPSKMGFGALRVINDDIIAPSNGFPSHSHQDMEIVTIPLGGSIAHRDSTGTNGIIKAGEVQIMSAGTGITHSEFNASESEYLKLFQIWILPERHNLKPRYDQAFFKEENRQNQWQVIVSPSPENTKQQEIPLKIYQQSYFNLADVDSLKSLSYNLHNQANGAYLLLIDGQIEVENVLLSPRDALEITEISKFEIMAKVKSKILLIETI